MPSLPARFDKWYLGSGAGLVWAPPFPRWLDAPGFWDEAHLFQYAIRPLFAVSIVAGGTPLTMRCARRSWQPSALTLEHRGGLVRAREIRAVVDTTLVSGWVVSNTTGRALTLDLVAWTAVEEAALAGEVTRAGGGLRYAIAGADRHGHRARIGHQLRLTGARSAAAVRAEAAGAAPVPPRFELTPFYDSWRSDGRLGDELTLRGLSAPGLVFIGLARRVRIPPRARAGFAVTLSLILEPSRPPRPSRPSRPSIATSRSAWARHFAGVPAFRSSDRFLERHWWHRWYGLRLNGVAPGAPNYAHPTVCEGIGYFHVPISYSAPCHVRELRWLPDPEWGRGVLRTFFAHQRADGSLHGRIYPDHLEGTDFYHADWGGAVLALDAAHPDAGFRAEVYPVLSRYGRWLARTRMADGSGLVDVLNHYETGQEYMSRYQAVDPEADQRGWKAGTPLKGVDVSVYAYRLFRALAHLARDVAPAEGAEWEALAARTGRAIGEQMWDGATGMFSDVDPATGARTGVKAAVCFYPYLTDLIGVGHVEPFGAHLFSPQEFWTPYPVPSSSVDDPLFAPDATWKGRRHNCPWNGRVWPMTNAHVIDALARVVRAHRPEWSERLGTLLRRALRMMTFDGDPERPNSFEHYHPYTARPSVYRGIDDYQHSWLVDLIVTHVMGVLPHGPTGVTVQPLRLKIARAVLDGLVVAGHRLGVHVQDGRFTVAVNGRRAGGAKLGEPVTVSF